MKTVLFALLAGVLLLPATCRSEDDADALVKQLGATDFEQREAAVKKLQALGLQAQKALQAAAQSDDAEIKKRASDLLVYIDNLETIDLLDNNGYYPLRVGSTWQYSAGGMILTNKVDGYEKVGEFYCAKLTTYNNGQPVAFEHLTVKKDGVYRCASAGQPVTPPVKVVSLPPKTGDEWKINSVISGQTLTGTSKVAEEKGVKVQAGSYDTVTISSGDLQVSGISMTQKMYLAKDVGMVKQEVNINGQAVGLELVKVSLTEPHAKAPAATSVGTVGQPAERVPEAA
ncbi:MAG: hypothetical protein KIS92_26925, partial [Planctomycetota bacterium]|nr:hypothetical protein [Planctomycetota bacterium]